jgi:stage III sporulation protein SpoIIIAA
MERKKSYLEIFFVSEGEESPIQIIVPLHGSGIEDLKFPSLSSNIMRLKSQGVNICCRGSKKRGVKMETSIRTPDERIKIISS